MTKTKKQHFVPQFLLRNFTNDGHKLWVFDKKSRKEFSADVGDIANRKYFYDIGGILLPNGLSEQAFERAFGDLESYYSPFLKKLIKNLNAAISLNPDGIDIDFKLNMNVDLKSIVASFISFQYSRTLETRKMIQSTLNQLVEIQTDIHLQRELTEGRAPLAFKGKKLKVTIDEDYIKASHLSLILDPKMKSFLSNEFSKKIWRFGYTDISNPLYISDNPISIASHAQSLSLGQGPASPFTEAIIPLSSTLCIQMYDRDTLGFITAGKENFIHRLSTEQVEFINWNQVITASRHVYCANNQFDLAKRILIENPSYMNTDRARIIIS